MSGRMWKKLVVGHGMNPFISSQNNSFCEHVDQETISCSCGEEEKGKKKKRTLIRFHKQRDDFEDMFSYIIDLCL